MREGEGRCAAGKVRHCCACSPRSAATKDDAWERRGPICWAGLGHPVSVGLQAATKSEGELARGFWTGWIGGVSACRRPGWPQRPREDEQTTPPEPHAGFQSEGGLGCRKGREDAG